MSKKKYILLFNNEEEEFSSFKNNSSLDITDDELEFYTHSNFRKDIHDCLNLEGKNKNFQKKIDSFFSCKKKLEKVSWEFEKLYNITYRIQSYINELILIAENSNKKIEDIMLKKQLEKWGKEQKLGPSILDKKVSFIKTSTYENKGCCFSISSVPISFLFFDKEENNPIDQIKMKPLSLSYVRKNTINVIKENERVINDIKKYNNIKNYLYELLKRYNTTKTTIYHLKEEILKDSKELERIYKLNYEKTIEWKNYLEKMEKIVENKKIEYGIKLRKEKIEKKKSFK